MVASIDWRSILAKPGIGAAIQAQAREARSEIHYAYHALDLLGTEATLLGHQLRAEGNLTVATPVALVATVLRQQVTMATGTEWLPEHPGGACEGDPGLEDLSSLPALEAAEALREELQTLALLLANASDCAPASWGPSLSRCVGSIFLVAAQLQEIVATAPQIRKTQR